MKIRLSNRNGNNIWLESIGRGCYKFCGEVSYMSVIGEPDCIIAIDPDGGPMISIGDELDGKAITKITRFEDSFILETA